MTADHIAQNHPQALSTEIGKAVANSLPPMGAWAFSPNTVVAVVTVAYVVLQALYLLRRWWLIEHNRELLERPFPPTYPPKGG